MYIKQAFQGKTKLGLYALGALLAFSVSQIGGIFLVVAVSTKLIANGQSSSAAANPEVLMTTLDSNLTLLLMLSGFALGLGVLLLFVKYVHKQSILKLLTTRPKLDWKRVGFGFAIIAVPTLILSLVNYMVSPEDFVLQFDLKPFLILLLIASILIPIQTSFEEILFRSYLMQAFGVASKSRAVALVLTSLIFGLLHISNPEVATLGKGIMVYYIGVGLFLGMITLMDDGVELALGYHAANNFLAAILITTDWSVFRTHAIFKDISAPDMNKDVLIGVFIILPTLFYILSRKYKWTNYREKLLGKVELPIQE